ncbi:MAG: DUF2934 domain-containing protein [Myxococcales bacterium]
MSKSTSQTHSPPRPAGEPSPAPAQNIDKGMSVPDEAIARRAYEKFLARGCAHGFDHEDWFAAKQELITEAFAQYGVSTRDTDF